ncbi:MAG: aminomethyl-transferring glycine dehydrogenase subunit GcvPA, partial [Candidatus Omnitrophica bacterium]|nr:aminomethyl-transferring glycine dehydrogenase subunit GcvPA [Candidatus Omnitrophota bacterium]
ITELTGLDVSNASHYDGATSLAEAVLLALHHTERTKVLVSRSVNPQYREVLKTYLRASSFGIEELGFQTDFTLDRRDLEKKLTTDIACVVYQTPNFFGVVEDLKGIGDQLHAQGTLLILVSHPLSLGIFTSPGEWNADISVGEGQPLGIPMSLGGPYLGYFSVTRTLMRRLPGRLVGMTQDVQGRRAFCLTLQAREQHIRRERASSNICTNQALCALAACVYMTLLGKEGIREVGLLNVDRSSYLRKKISELNGFETSLKCTIFNEFVVKSKKPFGQIVKVLSAQKIFPGIDLEPFYAEMKDHFLVCATETKTRQDLDRFVEALSKC